MKVLITDGHLKATLAAARSLGRRGIEVHTTGGHPGATLCSLSAFTKKNHVLPPYEEAGFDGYLLALLREEKFDYLLIGSEGALARVALNRTSVSELTRVDLPPQASVDLVLSKIGLLDFAKTIHIPIPDTVLINKADPIEKILDALSFPMVVKVGGRRGAYERVRYISDTRELKSYLITLGAEETVIFQEYIDGVGYGFFAFFENGEPVIYQMHRRIWEYPSTGGPSVLAETVDEPELRNLGIQLLKHLNWNGLAMVEFKKSRVDEQFRLMEINPRLWGSLDLSIASGVDFPYLAVQSDRSSTARSIVHNRTSFLWVFPDSFLFLISSPAKFLQFLRFIFSSKVGKNICRDDIKPLFLQIKELLYWIKVLASQRRLRYPHGKPPRRQGFSFDLHIHSSASYDSFSRIRRILKKANRLKLSAIAITDHESVEGAKKAQEMNQNPNLTVIIGSEVKTEVGDIIGLFLQRNIKSKSAMEVIQEIRSQGGLVMLPHPFSYGVAGYDEALLSKVDLIELRNSRNRQEQIKRVLEYAERCQLKVVGNSDAHFTAEIGLTRNFARRFPNSSESLKELIRSGDFHIVQSKTSFYRFPLSQAIKAVKRRAYKKVPFYCWWSLKSMIRDILTLE